MRYMVVTFLSSLKSDVKSRCNHSWEALLFCGVACCGVGYVNLIICSLPSSVQTLAVTEIRHGYTKLSLDIVLFFSSLSSEKDGKVFFIGRLLICFSVS